jgi:hypothetical protein
MALCMSRLAWTDAKGQALASVGLSAFAGAVAAHLLFPVRRSRWLWTGPLLVGLAGYVLSFFFCDNLWRIGQLQWLLGPLARPLPLDYASMGPAGALLGMWMAQRWSPPTSEPHK